MSWMGLDAAAISRIAGLLAQAGPDPEDPARIERIAALETLIAAAAAARALDTAAFVASQRAVQAGAGVPPERVGRGIAEQVALARRISPHRAGRYVGWAMVLTAELPHTLAALQAGRLDEGRALIVARETLFLSREHR